MKKAVILWGLVFLFLTMMKTDSYCRQRARWFKGNTHAHTNYSDGNVPPLEAIRWYYDHGYDFLVITDHNILTLFTDFMVGREKERRMLVIPGEEISSGSPGIPPIHVNGIGLKKVIPGNIGALTEEEISSLAISLEEKGFSQEKINESLRFQRCLALLQSAVDAVWKQGGLPIINHPNFGFAFDDRMMKEVKNGKFFELYNGHPDVYNDGDATHKSTEKIWEALLDSGQLIYGVAADDAHNYSSPVGATPGKGWIWVRAKELSTQAIIEAMEKGDFYASTGVTLHSLSLSSRYVGVKVKPEEGESYRIRFIGREGKVLKETQGWQAYYYPKKEDGYIRIKITDSKGRCAWSQPIFIKK